MMMMMLETLARSRCFNQERNHVRLQSWGVQFLGLGYYYPSTEKIRQVYPVWCSRLHNHTLFIKKLCVQGWGSVQILRVWTSGPHSGCAHGLTPFPYSLPISNACK